jgi:hypothetical protein
MEKEKFETLIDMYLNNETSREEENILLNEYISGHNDLLILKLKNSLEK